VAYLKSVVGAVVVALVLGAGVGVRAVVTDALARLPPGERASVLAPAVSTAVNCAALFLLTLVPASLVVVFVRRWRGRA
jgi:hypothetical protein